MAIPPFPSQDLAKLVLGYLAEEQLMTAYDEFLQASPYLDAMRNEYDRIFMTSLKNILAEYRAVKIYVETCKPFLLRKKLFQCVNLLEIVKFLVNNIDLNKIFAQDNGEKSSVERLNISCKHVYCEVCSSLKLAKCVCKARQCKQNASNDETVSLVEESLQNSTETTALADLPGNHGAIRKKQVKKLEKKNTLLQCNTNDIDKDLSAKQPVVCVSNCSMQQLPKCNNTMGHMNFAKTTTICTNSNPTCITVAKSNIKVCNAMNNQGDCVRNNNGIENKGISGASTFQDFAFGVRAGCENQCTTVPDSSTSEATNMRTPIINADMGNHGATTTSHLFFKVGPPNNKMHLQRKTSVATVTTSYTNIRPKTDEHRIKILSNIKVDNSINSNDRNLIPVLNNATSTPLTRMQNLFINGTPAYRAHPINTAPHSFTKDEIMAMPTLIVVPSSDLSQSNMHISPVPGQNTNFISLQSKLPNSVLSPLVLDVSSSASEESVKNDAVTKVVTTIANEVGLIKKVDVAAQQKMTSLPKDSVATCTAETSTPMVLPPLRKSSSTPRRTSHIRVLDFTTPRRVLHDTIIEQSAALNGKPVEANVGNNIVLTLSEEGGFAVTENNEHKANILNVTMKPPKNNSQSILTNKKSNWDDDLRAMIGKDEDVLHNVKKKTRLKTTKKRKSSTKKDVDKDGKNDVSERNNKSRKGRKKIEDDEPDYNIKTDAIPVKPTINIKPAADRGTTSHSNIIKEIENNQVKNVEEERVETPETDRLSLQNAVGAKLNISDLLETPYKQAVLDIQMETPRCLGPDMPGDPMSDIKIMNIPTPRFFDSPKVQATPSSYSSRPTDYSSGGSYYKPDDQDYLNLPDIKCPVASSKEEANVELLKAEIHDKRITRPVRQCAKNVSYYATPKVKDGEDKVDVASTCSETTNAIISHDLEINKDKSSKSNKNNESTKTDRSKRSSRKKKSPALKEKPKTFMKIKPRRVTPTKETLSGKPRKKSSQVNSPKFTRKRTMSKEKHENVTHIVSSITTKSRRKSSTPRKLHCTKTFNSESSGHNSPEISSDIKQQNATRDTNSVNTLDSDTEQLNLRWSDDGSQDIKVNDGHKNVSESEDISQIQEYIKTTVVETTTKECDSSSLQTHLVKRGFDEMTAKIIERDLLDGPLRNELNQTVKENIIQPADNTKHENKAEKSFDTDSSITNELQIVHNNIDDDDEIELSVHENNEETNNWHHLSFHDDSMTNKVEGQNLAKLKDTFLMEVCIEDGYAIRLRATPFNSLFDLQSDQDQFFCDKEMQAAVESISNIDRLYTPLKDSVKAQCYQIFDSTLTSLDTPLKVYSPKRNERDITVTEIILLEDKVDNKDKTESKKRKRFQNSVSSDDSLNVSKKTKPDTQYFLASANIQNIDIETVLTKLHGP